jgi:beta-aspartyl-peptidase (threonine type)
VIKQQLVEMGGSGGIIAADHTGQIALTFNTPGMYRASVDPDGNVYVAIYGDE